MLPGLALALLGLVAGVCVEGVVSSFHHDGSLRPWPRCRSCGRPATPTLLIPLAGYVAQRRCVGCGRTQLLRAAQIECATALAFVILGGQYGGHPLLLAVSLAEAALLVAVFFIDLELRLIPTLLVTLLVLLALGSAAAWPQMGLWSALLGGAIGFGVFGLLVALARVVFGEGALGMGDANLALAIGCITGYPQVVLALSLGVFLGGLGAVLVILAGIVARNRGWGLHSTIPYGPYLVLGVLWVLSQGNTLTPLAHL